MKQLPDPQATRGGGGGMMPLLIIAAIAVFILPNILSPKKPTGGETDPKDPNGSNVEQPADPKPNGNGNEGNEANGNANQPVAPQGQFGFPREIEHQVVDLETGTYSIKLDNRGGVIDSLTLKGYFGPGGLEKKIPYEIMSALDDTTRSFGLEREGYGKDLRDELWEVGDTTDGGVRTISFAYYCSDGAIIEKSFAFTVAGQKFDFKFSVEVTSQAAEEIRVNLKLDAIAGLVREADNTYYLLGAIGERSGKKVSLDTEGIPKKGEPSIDVKVDDLAWFGVKNKYFAGLMAPIKSDAQLSILGTARFKRVEDYRYISDTVERRREIGRNVTEAQIKELRDENDGNLLAVWDLQETVLDKGDVARASFLTFLGPQDARILEKYDSAHGFGQVIDYGWFWWFSTVLLWLLSFIKGIVGNWGVSIILLVIMVKVAMFFPVTLPMQVNQKKMSKIQPKIKELQEKHKGDKQKVSEATFKLYREHGINPAKGCLPMLIQIPIFFGLYRGLDYSILLRHQPFFGWIHDLSGPDHLFALPFTIPLVPGGDWLNLVPILMTISWVANSFTMPKSEDPNMAAQQRMFKFMPILFGFFLYNFASGLCLYMFTNSLMGILEIRLIRKVYLEPGGA